jgi:hypothetical protein
MTEARLWQAIGTLGLLVSAAILRVAIVDFEAVATSPSATYADGLFAYARGVLSAFLFVVATASLIAAHVMRVAGGVRHRTVVWLPAAAAIGVIGIALTIWKGATVAEEIAASQMAAFWMTNGFREVVAGCVLALLAALLVLGDRMASHAAKARPT